MTNMTSDEYYNKLKEHYGDNNYYEEIIIDLCNCFDSNVLTEFVEYVTKKL